MKKFNHMFTESILESNNQGFNNEIIQNINLYVSSSLEKMPDFMQYGVLLISIFFNHLFLFFYLKRFEDLDSAKRLKIINFVKARNVILLSLLVRLHETLILNRYFEYESKI